MQAGDCLVWDSPDEIRLKDHRIWLEHIVTRVRRGMSATDIAADLPSLTVGEVEAVLGYVEAHREEVEDYMARREAYLAEQARLADRTPPSPAIARMRRLRDTLKELGAHEALEARSARP